LESGIRELNADPYSTWIPVLASRSVDGRQPIQNNPIAKLSDLHLTKIAIDVLIGLTRMSFHGSIHPTGRGFHFFGLAHAGYCPQHDLFFGLEKDGKANPVAIPYESNGTTRIAIVAANCF
jgi:hypothetical protein